MNTRVTMFNRGMAISLFLRALLPPDADRSPQMLDETEKHDETRKAAEEARVGADAVKAHRDQLLVQSKEAK